MKAVRIAGQALSALREHGERDYPKEACGLLIGLSREGFVDIGESFAVRNLNRERAHDRYDLDPRGHLDADRRARESGRDIVGIYHSHPDHPAHPSEFDRAHAYPEWTYVIVRVEAGTAHDVGAFVLDVEGGVFQNVPIVVE